MSGIHGSRRRVGGLVLALLVTILSAWVVQAYASIDITYKDTSVGTVISGPYWNETMLYYVRATVDAPFVSSFSSAYILYQDTSLPPKYTVWALKVSKPDNADPAVIHLYFQPVPQPGIKPYGPGKGKVFSFNTTTSGPLQLSQVGSEISIEYLP
jgi:hypothetical protein